MRDDIAQAVAMSRASLLDYAVLMMTLRGQFLSKGWKLFVEDGPAAQEDGRWVWHGTITPIEPGTLPPMRSGVLLGLR